MSYDLEFDPKSRKDNPSKQPLLNNNTANGAASLAEIQETIIQLANYEVSCKGKMSQQERDSMSKLMIDSSSMLRVCKELLENYKKPDADTYYRKFALVGKQLEAVMEEIQRGEKLEITNARKTHVVMEEQENLRNTEEYKQKMGMQVKILEESDYVDSIIQDRQKDIDNISKIMSDIKTIAVDFNIEVDAQGTKLEDLDKNMGNVALNTKEATKQLTQASERSKKNGRCLMIIALVIVLCLIILFAILFGTKAI